MVKDNTSSTKNSKPKALLLGLGLDNDDDHVRITRRENFHLLGGSQDTHGRMQEQAIKINEKLTGRGKTLDNVSHEEFVDLAHEVGLKIIPDEPKAK